MDIIKDIKLITTRMNYNNSDDLHRLHQCESSVEHINDIYLVDINLLYNVILRNMFHLAELLINKGMDVNKYSSRGFIPMRLAAIYNKYDSLEFLLKYVKNINVKYREKTILQYVLDWNAGNKCKKIDESIIELLIENGACV